MADDPQDPAADARFERADDAPTLVRWAERAAEVGAQPHDAVRGAERFAQLWAINHPSLSLAAAEFARIGEHLQFVSVPAGRELIRQDEQGDFLLIVLDGRVAVERVQPWGARAGLAEARSGDLLGEMALLDAGSRFSACSSLTPCVLAVLDAQRLDAMMRTEPRLALALMTALARRLSLRLRQVSARLSALLSGG